MSLHDGSPAPRSNLAASVNNSGGQWVPASPFQLQGLMPGYEVIELIGQGGMGAVYHARQISLDRPVAIKILPPAFWHAEQDYAERFRHEARLMARLSHPGMIAVHDFGSMPDGQLYFIMEFVEGTDVAQMLLKKSRLAPLHALAITAHVCDALTYAHEHGVIHRDIKPANVMVDREGRVKVADFGLARLAAQESASAENTMTMGTPDYVAPESLVMGVTVDARADLYSLGVMLYEMLTGQVPRGAYSPPSAYSPGLDPRFDRIIVRALQHDPARRYKSAVEFRTDLDRIVSTPIEKAQPAPPARTRPPQSHFSEEVEPPEPASQPWGLMAVGLVVLVAAAVYYFRPVNNPLKKGPTVDYTTASSPTEAVPSPETKAPPPVGASGATAPVKPQAPVIAKASPSRPPEPPRVISPPEPSLPPQAAESEVTRRLNDLDSRFQAALDREVTKIYDASLSDLDSKYVVALVNAQGTALAQGRIVESQAMLDEKNRIESHQSIPTDDTTIPESLRKLRVTYRYSRSKTNEERQKIAVGLYDKYQDVLAAYQLELTRAGRLEEAVQVTTKRREVALAAAHSAH